MFNKVVVPVDFSDASRVALQYAVNLVQGTPAEIIVLHVVQPVVPITPDAFIVPEGGAATPYPEEMDAARQDLSRLEPLTSAVKARSVVRTGEPGPEIVALAKEEGADLIVLSTHGRTGLMRLLMGSVSESVIRHSDVPVLTLRRASK